MKPKSLMFVGLLTCTSCANQSEGFSIAKFYPVAAGCDGISNAEDVIAGNGYLDVAAGSPQFFVGMKISGAENIQQGAVAVGSVTLERENRNTPIVSQQVVNYRLSKAMGAAPKPYLTNISLPFSENGEIIGPFQVISPQLGTALFDTLNPPPGPAPSSVIEDFVDISVDVEFKGEFSASRTPFTTGVLTFPIRAYKSLPITCPNGYVKFPDTDPNTTGPDFCRYAGQSSTQLIAPPPPSCCPAVGTPGC